MSEEKEDSEKTEEATQHKIEKSWEKGQVAFSNDLLHWTILATFLFFLNNLSRYATDKLGSSLKTILELSSSIEINEDSLVLGIKSIIESTTFSFGIFSITSFVLVVAVGFSQTKLLFSSANLKPKISKISPMQGLKRIYSKKAIIEFLKGMFKMFLIVISVSFLLKKITEDVLSAYTMSIPQSLEWVSLYIKKILLICLSLLGVLAIADYFYQRYSTSKELKMTKQEVKEEQKDQDGNPEIKQKLRQMAQEKLQQRMMQEVPSATAIIVNPTHYSVAIKYDMDSMAAPKVVAKGVDNTALRIREIATENNIPIIENPPLARNLFEIVELDDEIPMKHYKAVAEVIKTVMKIKSRRF